MRKNTEKASPDCNQYFPPNNPAVQQQQATGLPQLTEDQLLGLAELV